MCIGSGSTSVALPVTLLRWPRTDKPVKSASAFCISLVLKGSLQWVDVGWHLEQNRMSARGINKDTRHKQSKITTTHTIK